MTWFVLGALAVLLVAGLVLMLTGRSRRARGRRPASPALPLRRCRRCQGTGWIGREPERTFTFTGEGFEDVHKPATVCPDCGGTGVKPSP